MHSEADASVTISAFAIPIAQEDEQVEDAELADWRALSLTSIWELWDNEEDAVYNSP